MELELTHIAAVIHGVVTADDTINKLGAGDRITKAEILQTNVDRLKGIMANAGFAEHSVFLNRLREAAGGAVSPAPPRPTLTIVKDETPPEEGEAG